MKYIDGDKIRSEIERIQETGCESPISVCNDILSFIDFLQQEQPEVDFEKEYTEFVVSDPVYSKLVNDIVGKSIARHFYELGLKARKEE